MRVRKYCDGKFVTTVGLQTTIKAHKIATKELRLCDVERLASIQPEERLDFVNQVDGSTISYVGESA